MAGNPFEAAARETKAQRLAGYLRSIGVTGQDIKDARQAPDYEWCWEQTAHQCEVSMPSSQTRRRVVEILEGRNPLPEGTPETA